MYLSVDPVEVQQRIERLAPLVKRMAHHMISRLPASVQLDDLIQAGLIGLMEAARNFDEAQGVLLETYASQRIRGAMLDELRESDWVSRSARKNGRLIEQAIHRLGHQLGRNPLESEIAAEMDISLGDYQAMLEDSRGHQLIHYEDFQDEDGGNAQLDIFTADHDADPFELLSGEGFRSTLVKAITVLPEREQMVMSLYYEEELNLKEIGLIMEVSESRVCQLHSQAINRLRCHLSDWVGQQKPKKSGKRHG